MDKKVHLRAFTLDFLQNPVAIKNSYMERQTITYTY